MNQNDKCISNKKLINNRQNNNSLINIDLKNILEYKDFELNSFEYLEALKSDKRDYFEFYMSLLKNNHPIFFSFFLYKDYNSVIKIFIFFFSLILNLVINCLFFRDETMEKIYEDKGSFNFIYQIPQILYSSLISLFIMVFINMLGLSQDNIVEDS